MPAKKSWNEKMLPDKKPVVKQIEKSFTDIPANSKMLIPTPLMIDAYIRQIPGGKTAGIKTIRKDLALENNTDATCPVTTGIFMRIVAEAAYEQYEQGKNIESITPFWRVIEPNSPAAKKLSFGQEFLIAQRVKEEIN